MKTFTWKEGTPKGVKELWYWQMEGGNSFNCQIFKLLGKADSANKAKIANGWPELYEAWTAWQAHPNSDKFFEQFQILL